MTDGRTTTYNSDWLPDTVITWRGSEQNPVLTRMIRYDDKRPDRIKSRTYQGDVLIRHIGYYTDSRLPQFVSDEHGMRTTYVYGDFGVTQSSLTPETGSWADDYDYPVIPVEGPIGNLSGGNELNGGGQVGIDPPSNVSMYPILDTYYHYDSFGRQDSITAPDGSVKAVSLAWVTDVPGARYMTEQTETNKPAMRTWYDALGRKVRQGTQRADGTWTYVLYEYDTLGRLARESIPTTTGNASNWTTYTYDETFDRLIEKEYPDGHSDTYAYDGLTTTSVVDGVTTTRTFDALGNLVSVTDGGGTLQYTLRPDGQPSEICAPGDIATTLTYDQYGRRVSITDPSAGTRTTAYDANGHVASETDANQKTITSTYNSKGLLTNRTFGNDLTVTYSYNIWNNPTQMLGSDGHSKSWTYNDLQQLTSESTDGFRKAYTYDYNMLSSVAYSKDNDYICSENYTRMNGHLTSITLNTGDTIWALGKQNPRMLPTKVRLGKLNQSLSYDVYGHVTSREVTDREDEDLQHLQYYYNLSTGNMILRMDHVNGTDETFSYDTLNRLTGILPCNSSSCMLSQSTSYDGKGNITSHHTSGQYSYGFNNGNGVLQPYSFSELSSPSSLIPQREQHISFNAMQLPDTIREGSYIATFGYYGDMSRASMTVTDTVTHNVETRTYYDQQYNEFTKTAGNATQSKRILWLCGSPYNAPAALVKRYGEQNWTPVHVLRDNLGSITHVIDTTGVVLQEIGYSAWGMLRDVESLEPYGPDNQPELLLGRGYTGHEHLSWFGLVNMNARLYDPAVGRFLSPDPIIQAPDNTQNYNRYSYCLNNPLRYIDPWGLSDIVYYPEQTDDGEIVYIHYTPDIEIEVVAEAPQTGGASRTDGVIYFYVNWQPIWTPNPYVGIDDGGGFSSGGGASVQCDPHLNIPQPNANPAPPNWSSLINITSSEVSYGSFLLQYNGYVSYAWVNHNIPQLCFSHVKRHDIHGANAYSVAKLIKRLNKFTISMGAFNALVDGYLSYHALEKGDFENGLKYGVDVFVDGITAVPCIESLAANLAWNLGGRELFWQFVYFNHKFIIMPEYYNGTLGRPDTLPFK